ncbi:hypothetical protein Catovirus_1_1058 [Catovirus CTV1]|uniref:Uncharacterized protein n=1 Tax=Catovirus CTV1 TaxID=1977631 RepID=A0A1V0SBH1_9VIRU|nr:hypothetical protein Catovirus_1_1058 [Catovirus CTV1]
MSVIKNKSKNSSDTLSDDDNILSSDSEASSIAEPEDKNFDPTKFFTNKELMYYKMIEKFFKRCSIDEIKKMVEIINSSSGISLRVLDWFVTRYSKKMIISNNPNSEVFDVHISYKAQLKSYKKRYFDPFRRKRKFYFYYDLNDKSKKLYTTLGQLNFFKWAISNNIIGFVERNINQVTKAMNQSNKDDKKKKEKKKKEKNKLKKIENKNTPVKNGTLQVKAKKNDINVKATKTCDDDEVQIVVCFD